MSEAGAPGDQQARVRFADIQRVLALFTQGLTGRHFHLKPLDAQPAGGRAGRVVTDGDSIHLPVAIAYFASSGHNQGAYRITVLHQIGFLENGTFEFDMGHAATCMTLPPEAPSITPLTSLLKRLSPLQRAPDLERFFATWPRPALLRRIFTTLEDLRIDSAMRRRYPGARADLDRVLAHALATRPTVDPRRRPAALIEGLVQYSLGAARAALVAAEGSGRLARMLDAAAAVQAASASVYDSARAALDICALLEDLFRRAPARRTPEVTADADLAARAETGDDSESGGPSAGTDGDAEPSPEDIDGPGVEFRGELKPDLVYRHMRGGRAGSLPQDAQAAATAAAPDTPEHDGNGQLTPASSRPAPARPAAHDGPRSFLYDEWDTHAQGYRKAWCRVHEHRLRGDDFALIDDVRRRNLPLVKQVRRQFSRIKPESWRRVHRTSDGDELELDAVIETVIDRRAGHATDEHLYVRRDRGMREVAAAFLVDMSASTDFPIPDPAAGPAAAEPADHDPYVWGRYGAPVDVAPPAQKRRVIDVAREALALMCEALRSLGDSHAVYGFSGDGRDNVEFNVIKDFGDALSPRTWSALAAMEPRRSTRMGPAIRHAATKLARQPMRKKVLIIVSDGYPEDRDYGPERRDREYGILDTSRALQEAAHAGISTFCITIDRAGHDYLRRMCAAERYMVIDNVAALPAELSKVYRALTRASGRGR